MNKKILVISDNVQLTDFFQKLAFRKKLNDIDYRYSIINKQPEYLQQMGSSPIDIKNVKVVEQIINYYDIVFSLHCKSIFPEKLVSNIKCINIHPGLNPHNRGWYPQVFSIINNKPIGATIHVMDPEVDHGEIIVQSEVANSSSDTSLDLYNRVIDEEKKLLEQNILSIINNELAYNKPICEGNYNSIDDFKNLCKLDLEQKGTLNEHINLLRALTHGSFDNAYYLDDEGNKVFIRVVLSKERINNES